MTKSPSSEVIFEYYTYKRGKMKGVRVPLVFCKKSHEHYRSRKWYLVKGGGNNKHHYLRDMRRVGGKHVSDSFASSVWEACVGPLKEGEVIDHINRDSLDNRLSNLRKCTGGDNNTNRVGWCKTGHKYIYTRDDRRSCEFRYKGYSRWFPSLEEAISYRDAYLAKLKERAFICLKMRGCS